MTPQSYTKLLKTFILQQHEYARGERKQAPPPLMVKGRQGIGKSSVAFQVCAQLDCELIMVECATQDPVEVGGLLDIDRTNGKPQTIRAVSEIVAKIHESKRPVVLCFDDFHQGARMIQAAFTSAMDIRRTIGGSPLPPSCYIMGTMNLASEKTVYHDIPTNLYTRMRHLELMGDLDGWCDRAIADGISPELVAAVREEPQLLHEVDTSDPSKASSTGRTLYNADAAWKMRGELEDHVLQELLRGDIGQVPGSKLYARLSLMADMPRIEEILKNPRKVGVPKAAGAKYALSRSLALRATKDTVGAILMYLERLGAEHLTFALTFRIRQDNQEPANMQNWISQLPDFAKWLDSNQEYLGLITGARAAMGAGK